MATAASSLDSADPEVVEIDMEPSQHIEDDATKPLHRTMDADENFDYVLVYERCQEEEERDDKSRTTADKLQEMRNEFEENLRKAGLELRKPEPEKTTRQLVSSWLFSVKTKQTNKQKLSILLVLKLQYPDFFFLDVLYFLDPFYITIL